MLCSHSAFIFLNHKTSCAAEAKGGDVGGGEGWMFPKGWEMRGVPWVPHPGAQITRCTLQLPIASAEEAV